MLTVVIHTPTLSPVARFRRSLTVSLVSTSLFALAGVTVAARHPVVAALLVAAGFWLATRRTLVGQPEHTTTGDR